LGSDWEVDENTTYGIACCIFDFLGKNFFEKGKRKKLQLRLFEKIIIKETGRKTFYKILRNFRPTEKTNKRNINV
jgi:hypothetical protein